MSTLHSLYRLSGPSMAPYLLSGDQVFIDRSATPKKLYPGALVLVSRGDTKEKVVHRYVHNLSKGDRVKNYDEDLGKVIIEGLVVGRFHSGYFIDYSVSSIKLIHFLQEKLSLYNLQQYGLASRIMSFLLILTGKIARTVENYFFRQKMNQEVPL